MKSIPLSFSYLMVVLLSALGMGGHFFYPALFFPAFANWAVDLFFVLLGGCACFRILARTRAASRDRRRALEWMNQALLKRDEVNAKEGPAAATAERTLCRLISNSDMDLREIRPDYSEESLLRLQAFMPELLEEINSGTDAMIRLGVAGSYLGETACRNWGWKWKFRSEPSLKQFEYLVSSLDRAGEQVDPFRLALNLFTGLSKARGIIATLKKEDL